MSIKHIASAAAAFALALTLVACGGTSTLQQEALDEVSGVKVTAENAKADNVATTDGAITVEEGDVIVVSPFTEKGSFHLTITAADGSNVYDEDVEGKVLFTVGALPGTYKVTTSGNGVTGWMTVFAQGTSELDDQDAALIEELGEMGVDTSILDMD